MSEDQPQWWFPKKEFGFGWGMPTCWQGWVTLLVFVIALTVGLALLAPKLGPHGQLIVAGVLIAALLTVVVLKGEPLRGTPERGGASSGSRRLDAYRAGAYLAAAAFTALSIPLAFRRVPKNASYGFRIPSTLNGTNAHWLHVNQVAGMAGIAAGVLSIAITTIIARRVPASTSWRGPVMLLLTFAMMLIASVPPFLVK